MYVSFTARNKIVTDNLSNKQKIIEYIRNLAKDKLIKVHSALSPIRSDESNLLPCTSLIDNQPIPSRNAIENANIIQFAETQQSTTEPRFCVYRCETCLQRPNYLIDYA